MTQIQDAAPAPAARVGAATGDPRRWLALLVIAIAQLMVVLDATIVNIAMPSAQHQLHISDANRQWIVTAYTLAFGGLLLLGGRIADYAGRKRVFLIGLLGFAGASALGGAAGNAGTLFAARGLQGLLALVYGFTKAAEDGWSSSVTLTFFAVAAVLLASFVALEARTANPLLPLRVVAHRNRGGSFLVSVLTGAGLMGMFLFMTYYFQGTLHYSPLRTGIAYLPFSGALIVTAIIGSGLLPRVGPRVRSEGGR